MKVGRFKHLPEETKKFCIMLPPEERNAIEQIARKTGASMAQVIRLLIRQGLARTKQNA